MELPTTQRLGWITGLTIGAGLLMLCCRPARHPMLIYNPSESAPRGWYAVRAITSAAAGRYVLVRLPRTVQHLAAQRGYLPMGVPLVKKVGASVGDEVCENGRIVQINGVAVAVALPRDGAGRELVAWSGCHRLRDGEVFLVSKTSGASFDSRYYGPMERDAVIGEAVPLWIW